MQYVVSCELDYSTAMYDAGGYGGAGAVTALYGTVLIRTLLRKNPLGKSSNADTAGFLMVMAPNWVLS
jgi:hypothetical protein